MTFRTFTLKDFFDPAEAERAARLALRRPFTTGDLAAAGLHFIEVPDAGGGPLPPGEREAPREQQVTQEQLRLAREWVARTTER